MNLWQFLCVYLHSNGFSKYNIGTRKHLYVYHIIKIIVIYIESFSKFIFKRSTSEKYILDLTINLFASMNAILHIKFSTNFFFSCRFNFIFVVISRKSVAHYIEWIYYYRYYLNTILLLLFDLNQVVSINIL